MPGLDDKSDVDFQLFLWSARGGGWGVGGGGDSAYERGGDARRLA